MTDIPEVTKLQDLLIQVPWITFVLILWDKNRADRAKWDEARDKERKERDEARDKERLEWRTWWENQQADLKTVLVDIKHALDNNTASNGAIGSIVLRCSKGEK